MQQTNTVLLTAIASYDCFEAMAGLFLTDTLTRGCIKVHGGVPIVLCLFGDPL